MRLTRFLVALLAALAARPAPGQDTARAPAACDGRIVSAIDIEPEAPGIMGDSSSGFRRAALSVALQHVTTKPSIIQAFLQLKPGEPCTELRRAESERILRAQPFIADAMVRAVPDSGGRVRIVVRTTDEIPTVVGGSVGGGGLSSVTFGNGNVLGQGIYVAGKWKQGFAYRDGVGARIVDYHALGRPYTFSLEAERGVRNTNFTVALGHSFLTNLQRTAWHAGYSDVSDYASIVRPIGEGLALNVDRQRWDVGAVARTGLFRKSAFIGALLTHERTMPAADGIIISDSGFVTDPDSALRGRFHGYENLRLSGVLGVRLLSFMRARGFDALTAEQDVAKGIQIGAIVGRGIPQMGTSDRALYISGDIYAGVGTPTSFLGLRVEGEGRKGRETARWGAVVASGRLAWYLKPSPSHTLIASAELSGGWRSRLPFQLRLGEREGGVRGYDDAFLGGGQRGVVRIENRWALGHVTKRARVGIATFVDAGKLWAGDVPFGRTTGLKTSAGIGLLAAIPPSSQRLLRVDLAVPFSSAPGAGKWTVFFSVGNAARMFWREPRDVSHIRSGAPPSSIFSWP